MASNQASRKDRPLRRRALAVVVGAAALVAGSWLLSQPGDGPGLADDVAAASSASGPAAPMPAAKVEAASTAPVLASSAPGSTSPLPRAPGWPTDASLRQVQRALDGQGTPKDLLEAATMLSACQGADAFVDQQYRERDQPSPTGRQLERITGRSSQDWIRQSQDFQRQCQVFDAATLARGPELLKRAYDTGAKDAALPYLQWLNTSRQPIDPELRDRLQRDARQTAEDGDFMALLSYSFAFDVSAMGITEVQRQAYKEARLRIVGLMSGAEMEKASRDGMADTERMMGQWGALPPPLTAEQQREADALAARVIEAWRKRQGKQG
ncbi:hypothetical protein [Roseateles chitinivorans]|uniref:hypothetical protein n=1 Tax=Roseateles chitinivorans TaxID=2917965 RepID=UPI00117F34EF|nr:hypothetical protein [Roseateles chitinivorans]